MSLTVLGIVLINFVTIFFSPNLKNHSDVAWWSISLFTGVSILLYFLGTQAAKSENKLLFNNVIIASVFFKMMAAVVILVVYKKVNHPETKNFLVPFFITYFLFSIFETYFMIKLSNKKNA